MLDTLEAGDELEADKPFLVPLDMFQKEFVLGDVGIREVKLNLIINNIGALLRSNIENIDKDT